MLRKRDTRNVSLSPSYSRQPAALGKKEDSRASYVLLILGILVFLVIVPYLLSSTINKYPFGINNLKKVDITYESIVNENKRSTWKDVTIYSRKAVLETNRPYKYDENRCILRDSYFIEMTRLFDLDPYHDDFSVGRSFVFGKDTPVGSKLVEKLKDKAIGIKCGEFIDFGNEKVQQLFDYFNVTRAYVACAQSVPKGAGSMVHTQNRQRYIEYIKNIFTMLNKKKVPFTFIHTLPHDERIVSLAKENKAQVVIVPELLDERNVYGKAVQECLQYGFSTAEIAKYNSPSVYKAQQIANYILENAENGKLKGVNYAEGQNTFKPSTIANNAVRHIYPCNLTIINSERESEDVDEGEKIVLKTPSNAVNRFVRELRAIKRMSTDIPYLSIIVPIVEDVSEASFRRFVESIEAGITLYPLANIELIILEAGKPVHASVKFSRYMKRFVKVYTVEKPEKPFNLEAVMRNTGASLARGEFLLFVKPNTLFSPSIFSLVGERIFNKGILYTAPLYRGTFDILDSFKRTDLDNQQTAEQTGLEKISDVFENIVFINSESSLKNVMNTSISYFLLASSELFKAIGYFPQETTASLKDVYLNAMRLISGTCTMTIPYGVAVDIPNGEKFVHEKYSYIDDLSTIACNGDLFSVIKSKSFLFTAKTKLVKI